MIKFLVLFLFSLNAFAANVTDYGAACDGVTDDTIAIQNTINAEQLIEFPIGKCLITSPLTVNKAVVIQGISRHLSGLVWTSPIMDGLVITTDAMVDIKQVGFHAPLNAAAGKMVHLTGVTVNSFSTIKDCLFVGGWNQFYTTDAYAWTLDDNYHYGYVNTGVTVQNTYNADWGDSKIIHSTMSGGGPNSTSVYQTSSGGLRVNDNKFLGGAYAYRLHFFGNEFTSDLIYTANSVENQTVAAMRFGTSNNGAVLANLVITSNQYMNQPIVIALDSPHRFISRAMIGVNQMSEVGQYGIIATNIEDFIIGPNPITAKAGAINGIAIGSASQNGKVTGNRTKGFTTGIVNNSASTVVIN